MTATTRRTGCPAHSAGGGADGVADGGERALGVVAQGRDGGDAHHDDQGQHDRVLDGRRAVLTLQELTDLPQEFPHDYLPSAARRSAGLSGPVALRPRLATGLPLSRNRGPPPGPWSNANPSTLWRRGPPGFRAITQILRAAVRPG